MKMMKLAALALAAVLAGGVAVPAAQGAPTAAAATKHTTDEYNAALTMAVEDINAARVKAGLRPLAYSAQFSAVVRAHVNDRDPLDGIPTSDEYSGFDYESLFEDTYGDRVVRFEPVTYTNGSVWASRRQLSKINAEHLARDSGTRLASAQYIGVSVRFHEGRSVETAVVVAEVKPGTLRADRLPTFDRARLPREEAATLRAMYGSTDARMVKAKKAVKSAKAAVVKSRKAAKGKSARSWEKLIARDVAREYRLALVDYRAAKKYHAIAKKRKAKATAALTGPDTERKYLLAESTAYPAYKARLAASRTITHSKNTRTHGRVLIDSAPKR